MTTAPPAYICRYCRQPSDPSGISCPNCGAAINVSDVKSDSGWHEQPAIKDMARIQFGQSSAQIEGTQVPVVDFKLAPPSSIYFSHHTLLWTEPSISLTTMPMAGGWNRVRSGMPLVMMQASGTGHIALSDDAPGEVIAVPLQQGQAIHVPEHRFLTATEAVEYTWQPSGVWFNTGTGNERETHYPLGMNIDVFHAPGAPGLLLLHSPGNSFIRDLAPGEHICIQPTALLYKDVAVNMSLHLEYPNAGNAGFFTSSFSLRTVWLRLIGPGRVAMQSVFERPEGGGELITGSSYGTTHQRW